MSQPDSQEEASYVYPDPSTLDEGNPLGRHPYYRTLREGEVNKEASEREDRSDDLEEYQYDDQDGEFQDHTGVQDSEGYSTSQQEQLTTTNRSGHTHRRDAGTDCPCPVTHTAVRRVRASQILKAYTACVIHV
ncbi:hypothetical protein B9479_006099 [Cryptococcus floricola]|uniref:Uncharacterized protein n=1 Tax=Cryptococcus floricola TaxID=2591691 RepID=A0A5D3APB4_9TREE|nr:hypothetical protein B9479_006099 [Cryptococcus floricola]